MNWGFVANWVIKIAGARTSSDIIQLYSKFTKTTGKTDLYALFTVYRDTYAPNNDNNSSVLGWSDFEKNATLSTVCCAKLLYNPNSKISHLNDVFLLVAGPWKNLTVNPKMFNFLLNILKPRKQLFFPCIDQKPFCPFLENKKINKL